MKLSLYTLRIRSIVSLRILRWRAALLRGVSSGAAAVLLRLWWSAVPISWLRWMGHRCLQETLVVSASFDKLLIQLRKVVY